MSCPPEATWRAYLEGGLDPEGVRVAEAHLVACEPCRSRLLVLRDPGRAGGEPNSAPESAPAAPGAGVRLLLVAGGLLGLGLVGAWIDEWLFDARALDATALAGWARDLVFRIQDRAPGLFALTVGVAAMACVSALATLGVTWLLRRMDRRLALWLLLGVCLGAPEARALDMRSGQRVSVPAGETLTDTLFAAGEEVEIDGGVEGDVFVSAERLRVRGQIQGSLYAWAREIVLEGEVTGDAWIGAQRIQMPGRVVGSAHVAADSLEIVGIAHVGRDLWLLAERAQLRGTYVRDVSAIAEQLELHGSVGRDLNVHGAALVLGPNASVARDLELELPEGEEPEIAAGAVIEGEIRRLPPRRREGAPLAQFVRWGFWGVLLLRIAAAFVFGLGLRLLWPGLFAWKPREPGDWLKTGGIGLLSLLAAPLALAGLAVTLVALPLAALGLFAYLVAVYAAGVVVSVHVGAALLGEPGADLRRFLAVLAVGTALLGFALQLPFFGVLLRIAALGVGLGLIVRALVALRRAGAGAEPAV